MDYPQRIDEIPDFHRTVGPFECRFARTAADLDAVQKLRYEVFNKELGEGLATADARQRDEDEFDACSHHLIVTNTRTQETVGTYRLLTQALVGDRSRFYSNSEFELADLPVAVTDAGVELGRACVAKNARGNRIVPLLWAGIAAYLLHNRKRFLFGCASMPLCDAGTVAATTHALRQGGFEHPELIVTPQPGYSMAPAEPNGPHEIPSLLEAYISLGARICGPPALDRAFGTIDYFVVLDVEDVKPQVLARLTG